MQGWIKLHRQIQENEEWFSEPFTRSQAWIDLLLLANHNPGVIYVRGNRIEISRGQIGWSKEKLASRWGWSVNKVGRYLRTLCERGQTNRQKSNVLALITIVNYQKYQANEPTDEPTESRQKVDRRIANKNDKKEKKKILQSPSVPAFAYQDQIKKLEDSDRRDLNIIALYFTEKGIKFNNKEQMMTGIRRHLRAAKSLKGFDDKQLIKAVKEAKEQYPELWTLETLVKLLTR